MADLDFKRMVYSFALCMTLLPNCYYSVNPHHLSFVDHINTSELSLVNQRVRELLREMELCNESLNAVKRQ